MQTQPVELTCASSATNKASSTGNPLSAGAGGAAACRSADGCTVKLLTLAMLSQCARSLLDSALSERPAY